MENRVQILYVFIKIKQNVINKNNMSYITTGGGGMGNQLKKFISALRLNPNSKSHMSYYANIFKDKSLCVLDSKTQYTGLNTWRIIVLPSDTDIPDNFCKYTTPDKGFHNCDVNGRNIDHEYLRIPISFRKKIINLIETRLQFSDLVNDKVNDFTNKYGSYSSVHIRSFKADNFPNDKSSRYAQQRHENWVNVGRQSCINYINDLKDTNILISSDSQSECDYIKSQCKNKHFIQYISDHSHRSHENDFIDMVLLSKGNHMILSTISTYSEVAWYLSGCNENIHLC